MFKKLTHPTTKANAQENKLNSKIYYVNDGPDFTEFPFRTYDFNEELVRNYSKITKTLKWNQKDVLRLAEHCHRHPKRWVIRIYKEPNALQTRTLFWSANKEVAQFSSRKVHF